MFKNRSDFRLDIEPRITGSKKTKRALTMFLLLVPVAISALAAPPPQQVFGTEPKPMSQPAALIENSIVWLPEPMGLSLIIFAAMLLALAGINWAWEKPSPQNAVSGAVKPELASDLTSGSSQKNVLEKAATESKAALNSFENKTPKSLLARFCKKHNCSPAEFSERLLRLCLKPQARPWAFLLRGYTGKFFRNDLELIHQVENLSNLKKIEEEVNVFSHYDKFRPRTSAAYFFQHTLGMRLSSQRLVKLSRNLFT